MARPKPRLRRAADDRTHRLHHRGEGQKAHAGGMRVHLFAADGRAGLAGRGAPALGRRGGAQPPGRLAGRGRLPRPHRLGSGQLRHPAPLRPGLARHAAGQGRAVARRRLPPPLQLRRGRRHGGRRNGGNVTIPTARTPPHMARCAAARPHFQGLSPDRSYAMAVAALVWRAAMNVETIHLTDLPDAAPPILRSYQVEAVAAIRAAFASVRRVLFCLPTGGGKTVCFAYITAHAARKGNRVIVLAHRQEIADQISAALTAMGVAHGRIQPGYPMTADLVQVAMVATLARRLEAIPEPPLLVIDECYHAVSDTYA